MELQFHLQMEIFQKMQQDSQVKNKVQLRVITLSGKLYIWWYENYFQNNLSPKKCLSCLPPTPNKKEKKSPHDGALGT